MKSLNLTRPLLLMMVGLPGAGKTFFALQFSQTFGAPVVSFDRIRHELFERPRFNKDEEALIGRLGDYQLGELLKTQRTIILDGGCETKPDRQRLAADAKKVGYDCLIVWVQTDETTCRSRSHKRPATNPRPEDLISAALTDEQFKAFAKKLNAPTIEDHVVISGKHVYATQARMVLRKLAAPHQEAAEQAHRNVDPAAAPRPNRPARPPVHRAIIN